jgi:hypothetical protein
MDRKMDTERNRETDKQKKAEKKMFTINVSKKMKEERNETHIQVYRGLLGKDRRKSGKKQRYRQRNIQ